MFDSMDAIANVPELFANTGATKCYVAKREAAGSWGQKGRVFALPWIVGHKQRQDSVADR